MADYSFICYAHENGRFARRLARHLRRHGVVVWFDQWELTQQDEWDNAIEGAIRSCRNFVIILSPASINSWVVREQFRLAKQANRSIVPVLRQPCELPPDLLATSPFDFSIGNYHVALQQLTAKLSNRQMPPKVKASLVWNDLVQTRLRSLSSLLWSGWLGLLLLLLLAAAGSWLFWPEVDAATFSAPRQVEKLPVMSDQPNLPAPTPQTTPVYTKVRVKDGKVMVLVPTGDFLMGSLRSDPLAEADESPRHSVYLDAFWIDKMEVTNSQYRLCVEAGLCRAHRSQGQRFEGDYQPVVGVNWFQASSYCQWVGGRLPTEAEWEKAARGTDGRIFPWGNQFDGTRLNYCDKNCIADWRDFDVDDRYSYTAPVGSYPAGASPYGALDMSGNVWEWIADWYAADYYDHSPARNPTGPAEGQQRVVRGGSWYYYGKNLRTTSRHRDLPTYRYDNIGFRCVVTAGPG